RPQAPVADQRRPLPDREGAGGLVRDVPGDAHLRPHPHLLAGGGGGKGAPHHRTAARLAHHGRGAGGGEVAGLAGAGGGHLLGGVRRLLRRRGRGVVALPEGGADAHADVAVRGGGDRAAVRVLRERDRGGDLRPGGGGEAGPADRRR